MYSSSPFPSEDGWTETVAMVAAGCPLASLEKRQNLGYAPLVSASKARRCSAVMCVVVMVIPRWPVARWGGLTGSRPVCRTSPGGSRSQTRDGDRQVHGLRSAEGVPAETPCGLWRPRGDARERRVQRAQGRQSSGQSDESGRTIFKRGAERAKLPVCCGLRRRSSGTGRHDHGDRDSGGRR